MLKLNVPSFILAVAAPKRLSKKGGVNPSTVAYLFRFLLGIVAASTCFVLRLKGVEGGVAAAVIYAVSCLIVKFVFRYGETELKGKYKYVTVGVGTYIFGWVFIWILLYTVFPY